VTLYTIIIVVLLVIIIIIQLAMTTIETTVMAIVGRLWNEAMASMSMDTVKVHSHALGLFLFYLFVHFCLAAGDSNNRKRETTYLTGHPVSPSFKQEMGRRNIEPPPSPTRSISSQSDDDAGDATMECDLEEYCPGSTPAERTRFLVACNNHPKKAAGRLNHYLEWRTTHVDTKQKYGIKMRPTRDRDYDLWVESSLTAMRMTGEVANNIVLPRVIRTYQNTPQAQEQGSSVSNSISDQEGRRIFHIIPALMDDKLAKQSTYTLAVAIYLDSQLQRDSMEKVTICMDVRAGKGWPNIHALRLVPFMKNSLKLLLPLFPERLHKCVVYPLPSAFFYLWTMIAKCLDPVTRDKICVVSGKCTIEAQPPTEKLVVHLGEAATQLLEATRIASFKAS